MASPRVFISSTCYDLQDIRFQLRAFIEDFGFEPVMSEYGDIFYDYEKHVQDACLEEIKKCQLFIMIIGNNYGTIYHIDKVADEIPDSVTLKEFKKALEIDIYKHIYINKYVNYDYQNYTRALNKLILEYFQKNEIADENVEETKKRIKYDFDNKYFFQQSSYKYIFYFLDLIYDLRKNNAVIPFESFDEIKTNLRKQWAGFIYDAITSNSQVPINIIKPLTLKVENIETKINKLLETKTINKGSKITFDLSDISSEINFENLAAVQNRIYSIISDLLTDGFRNRIIFRSELNKEMLSNWLENLDKIIKNYKWSKYIDINIIFRGMGKYSYWKNRAEIPYDSIFKLYQLYISISDEDKDSFLNYILSEFNKYYNLNELEPSEDDLPF